MSFRKIKDAQIEWAQQQGIVLIGSKGDRGERAYTPTIDKNLFVPISSTTRSEFEDGDGGELEANDGPGKIQAVHSSSALSVNFFDYWRDQADKRPLAKVLELPVGEIASIVFEAKLPIMDNPDRRVFPRDPNLDVLIELAPSSEIQEIGCECKFTEPFRPVKPERKGLAPAYLREKQLWTDIPRCQELAEEISPVDTKFAYLHAAQLLKHALGLKHRNGLHGFVLTYLWFDVLGEEGKEHRREIDQFQQVVVSDDLSFHAITFQDAISSLKENRCSHDKYVDYLASRYGD